MMNSSGSEAISEIEYFSLGKRKTCSHCKIKTETYIWWSKIKKYITRFVTVETFCQRCFSEKVQARVFVKMQEGHKFSFHPKDEGFVLPEWLVLPHKYGPVIPSKGMRGILDKHLLLAKAKKIDKGQKIGAGLRKFHARKKEICSSQEDFIKYISRFDKN